MPSVTYSTHQSHIIPISHIQYPSVTHSTHQSHIVPISRIQYPSVTYITYTTPKSSIMHPSHLEVLTYSAHESLTVSPVTYSAPQFPMVTPQTPILPPLPLPSQTFIVPQSLQLQFYPITYSAYSLSKNNAPILPYPIDLP